MVPEPQKILKKTLFFLVGASGNVEGLTANMASLKLGLHKPNNTSQLVKLLDENLQWNDSALEVCHHL